MWMCSECASLCRNICEEQYLQVGMVDRERRTEKTLDNGHHCLCHILLQGRIGMITISGGVAHLKYQNKKEGLKKKCPHVTSRSFSVHAASE